MKLDFEKKDVKLAKTFDLSKSPNKITGLIDEGLKEKSESEDSDIEIRGGAVEKVDSIKSDSEQDQSENVEALNLCQSKTSF